jgi:Predicted nucleotide-binding protein containing TIR-like domain
MSLPVRTDLADIEAICGYLISRPDGASPAELVNESALDRRKLFALKFWGLIEDAGAKLRLSERGLLAARDNGAERAAALREVVAATAPYASVIARAVQLKRNVIVSTEVATHWHQHFRVEAHFGTLNYQAVCFFRVAEGAELGRLVVGRKGQQTRFELAEDSAKAFVAGASFEFYDDGSGAEAVPARTPGRHKPEPALGRGNRVFITHRMKQKILEQVKELLAFGKFAPVVARNRESVMDEMRRCDTAVIHVGADGLWFDGARNDEPRISGDVLIEIGAAMALYGRNFILLVEEGITLPANLRGPCECRYSGDELDMPATMTLFKAFNDFRRSHPARPLVLAIGADHVVPQVIEYPRGASVHAKN